MRTPPPPLLVSFKSTQNLLDALPSAISEKYKTEINELLDKLLPPVVSVAVVSIIFGVSSNFIASILRNPIKQYRVFTIKKGKKKRRIESPKIGLKLLQSWIGANLSNKKLLSDSVYGFVPKRNGVFEAAQKHCLAKWVYSIDLRDFFPNISSRRIKNELEKLGYSKHAIELISTICTYENRLPQGSPASPVLSNLVFRETDKNLEELAKMLDIRYTRYADDLVFSGLGVIPENLQNKIKEILIDNDWVLAEEKEYLSKLPNRLKVHGLLVHCDKPRLTKGYRNRIRAYKHLLALEKIKEVDLYSCKGHVSYANSLDKFTDK